MIFLLVFVISAALALFLSTLASRLGLIAHPGQHRVHLKPTPMVGGIAIYLSLLLGILLLDTPSLNLVPSMTLLWMVGVADDRYKLPSWLRFIAQAIAAYIMVQLTGVELTDLGGVFGDENLPLGKGSLALTIFATIGVINALNMSDGLDGQAGSIVVLVLATLIFLGSAEQGLAKISIAAVLGFLVWNLRIFRGRARLFMGDAGSTLLGLILAYLLIEISQQPNKVIPPVAALWLLALPLFDAVAVMLIRPLRGKSPFSADRIHYHHLLQDKGLSVNQTLLCVLVMQGLLILAGLSMLSAGVSEYLQLVFFLLCFVGYFSYLFIATRVVIKN